MASKKDYGIEEHLYEMLLDLYRLECSNIFRQPVDIKLSKCPDYYHVIKDPMDLSTLKANYKDRMYHRISDIKLELEKIIQNCRFFNKKGHPILKICDKFESCYQTRWKTLDALRKSMNIPDDYELNVKVDNLDMIDQRKHKKKEPALLQAATKKSEPPKQEFNYAFKITSKSLFPFEDPKNAVIPTYIDYEDRPVETKIEDQPQKPDSPEQQFKIKLEVKQEHGEMGEIKLEEGHPLSQMESIQKLLSQLPQPTKQVQMPNFNQNLNQTQNSQVKSANPLSQLPLQSQQSQQQQQFQKQELLSVVNPTISSKAINSLQSQLESMPKPLQPQVQQQIVVKQEECPSMTLISQSQQQINSPSEKYQQIPIVKSSQLQFQQPPLPTTSVILTSPHQLDDQPKQFPVQNLSNTPQKSTQILELPKTSSQPAQQFNIKQLLSRMPPPQSDSSQIKIKMEQQQQQQQQPQQIQLQIETPKKAFDSKFEFKVDNGNNVQILSTPKMKNKKTIDDSEDENYQQIPIQKKNESEKKRETYILKIDPIQVKQHSEEYKQRKEEKLNKFFMKLFSQIKKCLTQHKRQSAALDLILNGVDFPDLGRINMVLEWMRYDVLKIPFIEQQNIYRYLGLCIRICYRLKQTQNDLSEEFLRLLNKEQEELKMQQRQAALQQQKIEKIEQKMDIVEFDYKLLSKQIKIRQLQKINLEKHNQQKQVEIKIDSFSINYPKLQGKSLGPIDSDSEGVDPLNQTFQIVDQIFIPEKKNFSFLKILDAITVNSKLSLGNRENGIFPQISVEKMQFFLLNKKSHFVQQNKQFIQEQFDQLKQKYDQKVKDIQFNNICSKNYYTDEKNHQLFEIYQIDNYVEILLKLRYQDVDQFQCDVKKFAIDFEIQNILSFRTGHNFINYSEINKEYQLRVLQLPQSISEQIINSPQFQINSIFVDSLSDLQMNKQSYCGVQIGTPFKLEDYQFYIQMQIPFTSIQDLVIKLNEQMVFPIQI